MNSLGAGGALSPYLIKYDIFCLESHPECLSFEKRRSQCRKRRELRSIGGFLRAGVSAYLAHSLIGEHNSLTPFHHTDPFL